MSITQEAPDLSSSGCSLERFSADWKYR